MERPWLNHYERGVPQTIEDPQMTLPEMLGASVRKYARNPALIFFEKEINYQELDTLSTNFAKNLVEFGIKKGDRVAIMIANSPEFVVSFYGILKAGAVAVPINSLYRGEDAAYVLNDSGARILVILDLLAPPIKDFLSEAKLEKILQASIRDYLSFVKKTLYPLKGGFNLDKEFRKWTKASKKETRLPEINPEDLALLLYTSGTTGKPKGVMLTHKNLVVNAIQCAGWVTDIEEGKDRILGVLPFFHAFGITACMNTSIRTGAALVLLPKFDTKDVLEVLVKHKVTIFPGVPPMYVALNRRCDEDKITFPKDSLSLKSCVSGADTLLPEVQEKFETLTGTKMVEGYGQTEAGPVTHVNPVYPVDGKRRAGSIGLPISSTEAKIVDLESGEDLGPDKIGELVVRGPQIMKGYWQRPAETAKVLKGGWLYTGDIAKMDMDGYFYLVSRTDDMIKIKGEKVFPKDIEAVLMRHPKVKEAAVVGVLDNQSREVIKAYVVPQERGAVTEGELIAFCQKHLAEYQVPKMVEFKNILPKNFMQKVLKKELRK